MHLRDANGTTSCSAAPGGSIAAAAVSSSSSAAAKKGKRGRAPRRPRAPRWLRADARHRRPAPTTDGGTMMHPRGQRRGGGEDGLQEYDSQQGKRMVSTIRDHESQRVSALMLSFLSRSVNR